MGRLRELMTRGENRRGHVLQRKVKLVADRDVI